MPKLFVPGLVALGNLLALPAPLGSFTELLRLPGFPGPFGTPLIDAEPAPVEPALGDPAAVGLPAGTLSTWTTTLSTFQVTVSGSPSASVTNALTVIGVLFDLHCEINAGHSTVGR